MQSLLNVFIQISFKRLRVYIYIGQEDINHLLHVSIITLRFAVVFGWHFKQYALLCSPNLASPSASIAHVRIGMDVIKVERVTGRKARGPPEAGGNKLQVADFFFPSLHKIKRGFFQFCTVDSWFCLEQMRFSYVNETMYLLRNLPFFKMVPPKTNFFSFLKPWAQQTRVPVNCFMAGG